MNVPFGPRGEETYLLDYPSAHPTPGRPLYTLGLVYNQVESRTHLTGNVSY